MVHGSKIENQIGSLWWSWFKSEYWPVPVRDSDNRSIQYGASLERLPLGRAVVILTGQLQHRLVLLKCGLMGLTFRLRHGDNFIT